MKLLNFFLDMLGRSDKFSLLECIVFNAIKGELPKDKLELFELQLNAINKVHRSPDGKEINLYFIKKGKSQFPSELCFSKKDEFKLAVIDLATVDTKLKLRARAWCAAGHIFSIEYQTSFKDFKFANKDQLIVKCHITESVDDVLPVNP